MANYSCKMFSLRPYAYSHNTSVRTDRQTHGRRIVPKTSQSASKMQSGQKIAIFNFPIDTFVY